MVYRLEELSAATAAQANTISLRSGQEVYVTPPTYSIADSYVDESASWPRVVLDGDEVVGFIRGHFDGENPQEEFRSAVWRVTVAGELQGRGIGTFAVRALADEAKARGHGRLTAIWEPGEEGPDGFFRGVGFVVVRQTQYGENFGVLEL